MDSETLYLLSNVLPGGTPISFSVSTSLPPSPVKGQLWFQSDTSSLLIYTGTSWVYSTSSSTPASATATSAVTATAGQVTVCNPSSTFAVTLPVSPPNGTICAVYVLAAATSYVTVAAGSGNTLDYAVGSLYAGQSAYLVYNSTTTSWVSPTQNNQGTHPSGTLLDFAGATVPAGFLACDGSAVSRSTYAGLFAAIGTNWGSGDGTTTFNVPDLRGRATIGVGTGTGLTPRTLAGTTGTETVTLTSEQSGLPSHTHTVATTFPGTVTTAYTTGTNNYTQTGNAAVTTSAAGPTDATTAHNNMQPSAVVTKIIKY